MLNIDDRILQEVTSDEYWFLSHLAKRIRNSSESCFPSISTISKDTGMGLNKCRKIKKELEKKGKIEVAPRYTVGGLRTSDSYIIKDKKITIMMGVDEVQTLKSKILELNKMIENLQKDSDLYPTQTREVGTNGNREGSTNGNREGKLLTNETNNVRFSFTINSKEWSDDHIEEGFNLFWDKYGLKQSKSIAFTSWKKVCKNGDAEKAYNGIENYNKHLSIEKWKQKKMASTWLNQKTWEDEYNFTAPVEIEEDDFQLNDTQEAVYQNWIEEGKQKYPALVNSKTIYLTRRQLAELMIYANKPTTRIEFTIKDFKIFMQKCFKELNDFKYKRDAYINSYNYIIDEAKKEINR